MTPVTTVVDALPTDRPISFKDDASEYVIVRIYDGCTLSPRRRRELVSSLRVQGFIRLPKERNSGYETWRLKIRARYDARHWQPLRLAADYGVRYLTTDRSDPMIDRIQAGIIKRGDSEYEVISRES